ncbi:unnamed protein product [Arabidopsis arenosa]|uniref:Pentatricopeptide repeat-containing protein n=1 Tax=Arabidopsis arenosa TaxID=38785 RepID=A0A8S1ZQ58_ARAAE|nr:unnamed protein product [Arabidopsis arenosa]
MNQSMKRLFSKSLCTSAAGANLKPPPGPADPAAIAKLILSSPTTTHQTLDDQFLLSTKTTPWTPNLVNSVLKRLWNHGPKALQFFHFLDNHHREYVHDASSFDLAIDIAARLHLHPTVWSLIHRMRSLRIGPSPKTFAIVAERYASSGKPDKAVKLFLNMHEHGCFQDLASFNTILDVLCKSKRVEKAYELFRALRGRFSVDTFSRGEELMQRMQNEGCEPNFQTYNMMIRYYSECSEVEKALGLFEKMGSGDCLPNLDTYNILISGMFVRKRSEDMVVAGKLLLEMGIKLSQRRSCDYRVNLVAGFSGSSGYEVPNLHVIGDRLLLCLHQSIPAPNIALQLMETGPGKGIDTLFKELHGI